MVYIAIAVGFAGWAASLPMPPGFLQSSPGGRISGSVSRTDAVGDPDCPGCGYVRNREPVAGQVLIDDITQNELANVQLTHPPTYDSEMPLDRYGVATRNVSTRIGPLAIDEGRRETLVTIVHEEMHHRLWARGARQSESYVEAVAQRFARMIGVLR